MMNSLSKQRKHSTLVLQTWSRGLSYGRTISQLNVAKRHHARKNTVDDVQNKTVIGSNQPYRCAHSSIVQPEGSHGGSELQRIRKTVEKLKNETKSIVSQYDGISTISPLQPELSSQLIKALNEWYDLTQSFSIPRLHKKRNRLSYFGNIEGDLTQNHTELDDLKEMKITCAESMDKLLLYHKRHNIPADLPFGRMQLTKPFSQVMEAWNQSSEAKSGAMAASVLETWGEIYGGDMNHAPTINDFNIVLDAYAKASTYDYNDFDTNSFPAELAFDIFSFLSQLNDINLLPNVSSCVHTIHALTNHAFVMKYASQNIPSTMNADVAAIRAYSIWKQLIMKVKKENKLNEQMVSSANNDILSLSCHGLLRRDDVINENITKQNIMLNVGQDTQHLFSQIMDQFNFIEYRYSQQLFLSTMYAWTREQYERTTMTMKDDSDSFKLVESVIRAAVSTESLLVQMKEKNLHPTPEHYETVIRAYFNCLRDGVLQADVKGTIREDFLPHVTCFELLKEMESRCISKEKDATQQVKIPANMYVDVINAYCQHLENQNPLWEDVENMHFVLNKMMDLYERDLLWIRSNDQPVSFALNQVLKTYSQINQKRNLSVKKSIALLKRFNKIALSKRGLSTTNSFTQHLDERTYMTCFTVISKSKNMKKVIPITIELLDEMKRSGVESNTPILSIVIKIMGQNGDGAHLEAANDIVKTSFDAYQRLSDEERVKSDFNGSVLYASLISAKIKGRLNNPIESVKMLETLKELHSLTGDEKLKPDAILYGAVLDSISKKKSKTGVQNSLELLNEMESMYRQGHYDLMPTKQCYTSVINTLSRSDLNDRHILARDALQRMENLYHETGNDAVKPDHISYSSVLQALSRSKSNIDYKYGVEVMNIMEEKAINLEFPWPNAGAYTALINLIRQSGQKDIGESANAVIERMDKANAANQSIRADNIVYCAALRAWASSRSPHKSVEAWKLFNEMCQRFDEGDFGCKPNTTAFNFLLNVCAYNKNKDTRNDSVRIALLAQEKLLKNQSVYGRPDAMFFERLIKVFGWCITDTKKRQPFVSMAFERCAKEGLVDNAVLKTVQRFAPRIYQKIGGDLKVGGVSIDSIPADWSRNIDKHKTR